MAPSSFRSLAFAILLIVLSTTQLPSSLGAASGTGSHHHDLMMLDRFHRWMSAHGRSYKSADEKLRRLEVYRRNVEYIEASNRDPDRLGYELGENPFTDLTNEEFVAKYASSGGGAEDVVKAVGADGGVDDDDMVITTLAGNVSEGRGHGSNVVVPVSFDWRAKGMVTPVKFQGPTCGSCWAFVAVALVESLVKIKVGITSVDLSEQELVDCDPAQKADPCQGGDTLSGMQYVQAKGGLVSEVDYPYVDKKQPYCKDMKGVSRVGKITGVTRVAALNEPLLATYILQTPVSVSMDATGDLQYYKSGVYKGPCTGPTNHGVVLVGWGVDATGVKYWIAKNSWSSLWGQNGFFFMRKEADGPAGLCSLARIGGVYPVM